ncbi:MAG: UPF0280 family protein [Clostridiales bacterium]|nr:UPF0280 family protein [Clostridiales bacterium]MCF8021647.1 UPF0280 family protein [Clostridiales bacterium]
MHNCKERTYRLLNKQQDLTFFQVKVQETDLDIGIPKPKLTRDLIKKVENKVVNIRYDLEYYLKKDVQFAESMKPYLSPSYAPEIAVKMAKESSKAGVGPMASVAGAISEVIGELVAQFSKEIIVENGGDIYLRSLKERFIGIYAASSPFSNKIALKIKPHQTPIGICTSSGVIGHSISEGKADAVIVLAPSVPLADAAATATGNIVHGTKDLQNAVDFANNIPGVSGSLAIKDDKLAAAGNIEISPL